MSLMTSRQPHVWSLVKIAAANERALVRPPLEISPVRLVILKELSVEFEVLSDFEEDDVVINMRVPPARPEGK